MSLISINKEHNAWQYIWEKLWDSQIENEIRNELHEKASLWLNPPRPHRSWAFVWCKLWAYRKNDALKKLGFDWLSFISKEGKWGHPGFGKFLSELITSFPSKKDLIVFGVNYLRVARPSLESIRQVVKALLQNSSDVDIKSKLYNIIDDLSVTAIILAFQGNLDKAQKDFIKIIEILNELMNINPSIEYGNKISRHLIYKGMISLKQNKTEEAKDEFNRSLKFANDNYLKQIALKLFENGRL